MNLYKVFISSKIELSKNEDNQTFFENGEILKKLEEDEKIDKTDFELLVKRNVSDFINRSFDNIVVLAGAGSSVVNNQEGNIDEEFGKTVLMIAKDIDFELGSESEFFSLQDLADMSKYSVDVKINEGEFNNDFNLEDFLSNVITFEKYVPEETKEKYIKTKDKIFELIKNNTSYSFDEEKLKHATFINTLAKKVKTPNKLSIVTTNYDTLFEEAAENINYTVIDGFSFSHNPYFDSDLFEWSLVKDVPDIKTKEFQYKKNIFNLLKIHGSITWEESESKIRRKNKDAVNKPIMIFPSSNKYMQSYQEPYFELFSKFQDLLKKPNTLLITTGFSFADNHIAQMIVQAITHNTSLSVLISDYNIEHDTENWNKLVTLMEQKHQIAFLSATMDGNLINYLGD